MQAKLLKAHYARAGIRPLVIALLMPVFAGPAIARATSDRPLGTQTQSDVIQALSAALKTRYVFPDVGDRLSEVLEVRRQHGDYDSITGAKRFARVLTAQMKEIAHDAHLAVFYEPKASARSPNRLSTDESPDQKFARDNFGFHEVKRLGGNVGYLKITAFADLEHGGRTAAAAMALLAHTDALIIDLRQNHGGDPEMVDLLASYFFPAEPSVHLNDLSWRIAGSKQHTVQQFWTLPYVPGSRYLEKQVYILVGPETLSAAEEFTYDLQALKRAVIVGASTWGGANPGAMVPLAHHFLAFIPSGEAINPITKTNWEGKGVQPDIPTHDPLTVAYKMALQHLIASTNNDEQHSELKTALAHLQLNGEKVK